MKGHVKLTTAEHRAWRVNKAQWVSPKGVVLRAVTPEEEQAIFPFVERTKRTGRTETYSAKAVYKVRNPVGQIVNYEQPMDVTVRSTRTGREAQSFLLDVFVNGNRYVKGREIIEKRMLAKHGECILFQPNGKRLRVIRNPLLSRPTYAESQRSAPHPDHCPCRAFSDRREPGRHHIACEWNAKAPPHEQASPLVRDVAPTLVDSPEPLATLAFDTHYPAPAPGYPPSAPTAFSPPPPPPPNPELLVRAQGPVAYAPAAVQPVSADRASGHPTLGLPVTTVAPPLPARVEHFESPNPAVGDVRVYAPEECPHDCRGTRNPEAAWAWPQGRRPQRGHHHPLCPFEAPHRRSLSTGQRWVLYDVERKVEVRDASPQEVATSEVELQRSGTRSVMVAGRIYAVVAARVAAPAQPRAAAAPAAAHETARQQALAQSGLPGVPGSAPGPSMGAGYSDAPLSARERAMMDRLAELERHLQLASSSPAVPPPVQHGYPTPSYPVAPPAPLPPAPLPPPMIYPVDPNAALMQPRPVASAADHLRNGQGLVGHQQLGDDIPLGEVLLTEPVPFVDPLPAMRVAAASVPAPYHPGGVHGDSFVPPAAPGVEASEPEGNADPALAEGLDLGGPDEESDEDDEADEETPVAAFETTGYEPPPAGYEPPAAQPAV